MANTWSRKETTARRRKAFPVAIECRVENIDVDRPRLDAGCALN
jgi:hypothetical protein